MTRDEGIAVAARIRDALSSLVAEVVESVTWKTDRGARHFVVANGGLKLEGEPCVRMPSQVAALERLSIETALSFKREGDTRLSWRRYPAFEEDGPKKAKLTFRMAWD